MIIISSRKDFSNPDQLSETGHLIREVDLANDTVTAVLDFKDLLQLVKGKRLLLLVHGYNNEQYEVFDSYQVIEQQAMVHLANAYDMVLGYSWPGGDQKLDWWQAKKRANAVARMFRFLLDNLAGDAGAVDVMSHSLGARVTLKALKGSPGRIVRNYFCTAPAVDNECFESDEEFADAIPSCERVYIFHSSRDEVLRFAYASSERDLALGLYGPEDKTYIEVATRTVFVANCKKVVSNHGGYKRTAAVYDYIQASFAGGLQRFVTL
ncbi:alpha/beta hydrolase [Pseudomonas tohonis]|uniref:alpha/beta hydrolase n=1 Tax=Pseudomonas tohonis TaxID=2725477 RepID=UPI0021D8A480|nr:alpha/beta hydrolase [Pseudomonas tohonis]UXY53123.1 alpha/beta hydrolase [Pseudomonas tohonis]